MWLQCRISPGSNWFKYVTQILPHTGKQECYVCLCKMKVFHTCEKSNHDPLKAWDPDLKRHSVLYILWVYTVPCTRNLSGIQISFSALKILCVCVCVCVCVSRSVMSDSLRPQGLYPARFLWPWNSPGKKTGVGWHSLLQGIFLTQGLTRVSCIGRQILYPLSHKGCPPNSLCLIYLSLPASTPSPQQPLIFYYNCVTIFQLWFIILSSPDCHIVGSYSKHLFRSASFI